VKGDANSGCLPRGATHLTQNHLAGPVWRGAGLYCVAALLGPGGRGQGSSLKCAFGTSSGFLVGTLRAARSRSTAGPRFWKPSRVLTNDGS